MPSTLHGCCTGRRCHPTSRCVCVPCANKLSATGGAQPGAKPDSYTNSTVTAPRMRTEPDTSSYHIRRCGLSCVSVLVSHVCDLPSHDLTCTYHERILRTFISQDESYFYRARLFQRALGVTKLFFSANIQRSRMCMYVRHPKNNRTSQADPDYSAERLLAVSLTYLLYIQRPHHNHAVP